MSDLQLPSTAPTEATSEPPGEVTRGPSARVRIGVGAAIVLVVVALVCSVLITALSPVGATTLVTGGATPPGASAAGPTSAEGVHSTDAAVALSTPAATDSGSSENGAGGAEQSGAIILVHLLGAVAHPGVYELAEGSRVVDAVGLAGGFTETAEQASVNLARPLADGEQVRVLSVGEAPPAGSAGSGAAGASAAGAGGAGGVSAGPPALGAKIDLNAATELDLDALPRIGPAMAARIVGWRTENGRFGSVDDLLQVTGIGEKTLEGLRDLVTV